MIKKIESILTFIFILLLSITLILRLVNIHTKIVQSDSMYPSIKTNDLVYINQNTNNLKISVGDVVAFRVSSNEVLHRVVEINGNKITTKGDNNQVNDLPIDLSDVTGKLVITVPYGGHLLNLSLWFIVIGLYGIIFITRKIINEFRKE